MGVDYKIFSSSIVKLADWRGGGGGGCSGVDGHKTKAHPEKSEIRRCQKILNTITSCKLAFSYLLHILDTILVHCILHILGTMLVHCLI